MRHYLFWILSNLWPMEICSKDKKENWYDITFFLSQSYLLLWIKECLEIMKNYEFKFQNLFWFHVKLLKASVSPFYKDFWINLFSNGVKFQTPVLLRINIS